MQIRSKQSYHPFVVIAFYLNILPENLLLHIPRSTKHEWKNKSVTDLFGYEWYCENQQLFSTLQNVASSKRLIQINKALLRIIAIKKFAIKYKSHINHKIFNAVDTVVSNIVKVKQYLGLSRTLKLLQLSHQRYWQLKQKTRCPKSLLNFCLPKHPTQLLRKEVQAIKNYCEDVRYLYWPLVSIYHEIIRDSIAKFHVSTFYKYVRLLQIKRFTAKHRRKNHTTGKRATKPLELLHADITVFKTADNVKAYIYLIQDNFSRGILAHAVKLERNAKTTFELLQQVHSKYLKPSGIDICEFMTDDGSENFGEVQTFLQSAKEPAIQHIVAQRDVAFSNSMIEAANKNLKYRFLYHKDIPNFITLCSYVEQGIEDFNNRPHNVLSGLYPIEVLNGKRFDKASYQQQMKFAKANRIKENKEQKCCYSF